MSIAIRPTRPDHPLVAARLAELDAYLASLYPPEANHILDAASLLSPDVAFFAAWDGDAVVGTAALRMMPGESATRGCRYGEIKRMYVVPDQRGQLLGVRLLDTLEAELVRRGRTLALLETGQEQVEAVSLYQRCGYEPRAAFGDYPANASSLFFGKSLAPE